MNVELFDIMVLVLSVAGGIMRIALRIDTHLPVYAQVMGLPFGAVPLGWTSADVLRMLDLQIASYTTAYCMGLMGMEIAAFIARHGSQMVEKRLIKTVDEYD